MAILTKFKSLEIYKVKFRKAEIWKRFHKFLERDPLEQKEYLSYIAEVHGLPDYFDQILHPYHFNDSLDRIPRDTSPGPHWIKKGFKTKGEVLDKRSNVLRYITHLIKSRERRVFIPDTQVVSIPSIGVKPKFRIVWVYPIEMICTEAMFAYPIIDMLKANGYYNRAPARFCMKFCKHGYSFDYSNFDATVPGFLIRLAFQKIFERFDMSEYSTGDIPYSKNSLSQCFWKCAEYFQHTPYRFNAARGVKSKGVPSGSMFTNIIDSIVSRWLTAAALNDVEKEFSIETFGDDVHISSPRLSSVTRLDIAKVQVSAASYGCELKVIDPVNGHLSYCKRQCFGNTSGMSDDWYAEILLRAYASDNCIHCTARCLMTLTSNPSQWLELFDLFTTPCTGAPLRQLVKYLRTFEIDNSVWCYPEMTWFEKAVFSFCLPNIL